MRKENGMLCVLEKTNQKKVVDQVKKGINEQVEMQQFIFNGMHLSGQGEH